MSTYHHFCFAFTNLEAEAYTYKGNVTFTLRSEDNHDTFSVTLSPMQAKLMAEGITNIINRMPIKDVDYGEFAGDISLVYPEYKSNEQDKDTPIEKIRPVA